MYGSEIRGVLSHPVQRPSQRWLQLSRPVPKWWTRASSATTASARAFSRLLIYSVVFTFSNTGHFVSQRKCAKS
eukprot:5990661-Pyramimonas_sp.AAC.1